MPYLVAARKPSMGRMGIVMANGAATTARSNMILYSRPRPLPVGDGSVGPIVTGPYTYTPPTGSLPPNPPSIPLPLPGPLPVWRPPPPVLVTSAPDLPTFNTGSPVPAGYPTSQIFVDPNGGFWQYSASQNKWMNVGTSYNTGATSIPPAVPTGSTPSAPTSLTTPTTAPAPVNVSVAAPSSSYQEILDWLQEDTLASTIGFTSIPNWIVVAAAGALAWKFSQPTPRSRNPRKRRRR